MISTYKAIFVAFWVSFGSSLSALAEPFTEPAAAIKAGRAALVAGDPAAALAHFERVLSLTGSIGREDHLAAYLGVGHAAFWLEKFIYAEHAYRAALALAETKAERELIITRFARTLTVLDRPFEAHALLTDTTLDTLDTATERARACLLLKREKCAATALATHAHTTTIETAKSWLEREFVKQQQELEQRLATAAVAGFEHTRDSDGVRTRKLEASGRFQTFDFASSDKSNGIWPQAFWEFGGSTENVDDGKSDVGVHEAYGQMTKRLTNSTALRLQLGSGKTSDWSYTRGIFDLDYRTNDRWGLSLNGESEAVKTVAALKNQIKHDLYSVGGDYRFSDWVVGAVSFYQQEFSDGNERDGSVIRVNFPSYVVHSLALNLSLQLYRREYESSRPINTGYFNPRDFREEIVKFLMAKRVFTDWTARAEVGVGRQVVDGIAGHPVSFEIDIQRRLASGRIVTLKAGSGDASGLSSSGSSYRRSYLNASLFIPF